MGSVRIVTRHEFQTAITRLSYIVTTAAVPVLVALAVAGFAIFTLVTGDDADIGQPGRAVVHSADLPRLGYVDLTNGIRRGLPGTTSRPPPCLCRCRTVIAIPESRRFGNEAIDALFEFPADFAETGTVVRVQDRRGRGRHLSDRMALPIAGRCAGLCCRICSPTEVPAGLAERLRMPYRLVTEEIQPD